ncbi:MULTISPECIES: exodeoxyribonuclease VII small subunit [unclassified Actinomyces]|uniref:exodeoxyribonuclease VII small subunit n=1 Tax=unclassified Actinomyces TaxID=2609248 RepID=UPI002017A0E3|nr:MULTISPECIES: exodeoxyribonuclease VII small subunit [unclassified Actinomyces]MCL3776856.1 exodeoxyribonuclease VII small subunit [Actinomyces sp. AC-20-1]MCL3790448.1 exodeoxyribonuclease VII small subunit [Actinomyces sp. 187325]MCL3792735.1 exodeoxyribonuclease VII small subunit [Actinomyces sp. 186855]MCL3794659.1 exodeoxyribonuclease VII small subunit [Actinomyces sp. 217892]
MSLSPDTSPLGSDAGGENAHADVASLSYERAREELVTVVQRLEAGQVPLEEALALWERGEALAARCQSWLDDARGRLAAVARQEANGSEV